MALTAELMDHYALNVDLIVINPFGQYKVGDMITDPDKVVSIMDSHNESFVTKVTKKSPAESAE